MKAKAHVRYKHNGVAVPGVTTVIGLRAKPALIPWANKLGLQGIDSSKYVDDKASIGTLAHQMILDHFKGKKTDTSDYSAKQIDEAENSLLSFFEWAKSHDIEPILIEEQMTSCDFGGTVDLYAEIDGDLVVVDFKTGSGIYEPEHPAQLAAYAALVDEKRLKVDYGVILNIPRAENENFTVKKYVDMEPYFGWFMILLQLYKAEKLLKGGKS
jgi:hypothetical protein